MHDSEISNHSILQPQILQAREGQKKWMVEKLNMVGDDVEVDEEGAYDVLLAFFCHCSHDARSALKCTEMHCNCT